MIDHMLFDKQKWFNIPQNAQSVNVDGNVYRKYPFKTITKKVTTQNSSYKDYFYTSYNWSDLDMNRKTVLTFDNGDSVAIVNYILFDKILFDTITHDTGYNSDISTEKGHYVRMGGDYKKFTGGSYYDKHTDSDLNIYTTNVGAKWVNIQINVD